MTLNNSRRGVLLHFLVRPGLLLVLGSALVFLGARPAPAEQKPSAAHSPALLDAMSAELGRAMSSLGRSTPAASKIAAGGAAGTVAVNASAAGTRGAGSSEDQQPPYFLSYSVTDAYVTGITAQYGALIASQQNHGRMADVLVRVGDPKLDNTHDQHRASALETVPIPLTDDRAAIERALWFATNADYGNALHNYLQVKTETQVRAKEEDSSPDFSKQSATVSIAEAAPAPVVDQREWEARVKNLSAIFRAFPDVYTNVVSLQVQNETDYFVSSEGAKIATPHKLTRLVVFASTRAEDGMDLLRAQTFEAENPEGLPPAEEVEAAVRKLGESLEALRKAPVTEPFDGPAILSGRAAAVFFHEVLGHRLEGQRQRGDEEGQTFTKNLGKPILPDFLSVADDPTLQRFESTYLSGTYQFDDEGQPAQKVNLIEDGVLRTFLMSRLPIASFSESNGHGRSQVGRMPTGRQGNLIVTSTKMVPDTHLRQMLLDEAKKQGKAYGLIFEDISSGFAVTTRNSPQAFQVLPLVVYRVYVDGRPDELVRGVSIVGTPRAALNQILATGTKRDVFNGECGAESGSIPVSAIAPAMLVSRIETQKQAQGNSRPPILPIPGSPAIASAKEAH